MSEFAPEDEQQLALEYDQVEELPERQVQDRPDVEDEDE